MGAFREYFLREMEHRNFGVRRNEYATKMTSKEELLTALLKLQPKQTDLSLIRVGPLSDGGYVLPPDLSGITVNISPGCDKLWEFERELYEEYRIPSILIDRIEKKPIDLDPRLEYLPLWIGPYSNYEFITLKDVVAKADNDFELGVNTDLMLQMDIEGAEWISIISTPPETLNRFRIIVLELHNLRFMKNNIFYKYIYEPTISKLLSNHLVLNVNGNNNCSTWRFGKYQFVFPDVLEITLIRKDRIGNYNDLNYCENDNLNFPNVRDKDPIYIDWVKIRKALAEE